MTSFNTQLISGSNLETEQYLNTLVAEIRKKVSNNSILKSENWTKSCYSLLEDLIRLELSEKMEEKIQLNLGVSVSAKTLKKLFDKKYKLSYPIDPRSINTLNKLVFFIGYKDWEDFIFHFEKKSENDKITTLKNNDISQLVRNAIQSEFNLYSRLSNISDVLKEYFINESQSMLRIAEVIEYQKKLGCIISNKFNPSTFEILDLSITKITDNYAQVATKEYWLLCWWNSKNNRYLKRYKNISDHFYILNKINNRWKIKTNASTSDIVDFPNSNLNLSSI